MVESKRERVSNLIREKGFLWTVCYIFNSQVKEKIYDKYTIWINKKIECKR